MAAATERLLTILKGAAGLVPMATALYLSNLTRYTVPLDIDQPIFDWLAGCFPTKGTSVYVGHIRIYLKWPAFFNSNDVNILMSLVLSSKLLLKSLSRNK